MFNIVPFGQPKKISINTSIKIPTSTLLLVTTIGTPFHFMQNPCRHK